MIFRFWSVNLPLTFFALFVLRRYCVSSRMSSFLAVCITILMKIFDEVRNDCQITLRSRFENEKSTVNAFRFKCLRLKCNLHKILSRSDSSCHSHFFKSEWVFKVYTLIFEHKILHSLKYLAKVTGFELFKFFYRSFNFVWLLSDHKALKL